MEILIEGRIPEEELHEGRCERCGCKVRFKRGEAEFHSFPKNESALSVWCPTPNCGGRIYVTLS